MKKTISLVILFVLVLSFSTVANAKEINVKILLNGEELEVHGASFENVSTIDINSRIMIPLSFISESLGHKVEWDDTTQTGIVDGFEIAIGRRVIKSKDVNYGFFYEPIIKDGKVYVELRLVSRVLKYNVSYEKPDINNNFTYIINLEPKPKRNPVKLKELDTSVSTINYNSVTNVRILTNGDSLNIPPRYGYPYIDKQGRTMIPLRIISEILGHKIDWDQATQTVTIDDKFNITVGENEVKTKDGTIKMDTSAVIKDNRTFVPVRFIVEALGYKIDYREPTQGNRYTHIIDIRKDGLLVKPLNPPIKDGNVYKIVTESRVVEVNLETDLEEHFGVKMGLIDEKAEELLLDFYNSIKLTVDGDNIKITMYKPELPTDIGMRFNAVIGLEMKEGRGYGAVLGIWGANGPNPHETLRDDGYIEINYNETPMDDVEFISFSAKVDYKGRTSIPITADLTNGKIAIGMHSYLLD